MIHPSRLLEELARAGVTAFAGVPDSLMKSFLAHVQTVVPPARHLITANEGAAVAVAIGHHLRTGETPLVYFQNSGLGNAVNPLLSLASPEVYGIPMLLLIGWRGEPGVKDEPQHVTQGRVMTAMLDAMDIAWMELPVGTDALSDAVVTAVRTAEERSAPVALLVRRGTFADESAPEAEGRTGGSDARPTREDALRVVADLAAPTAALVATTGMLGRELFELRASRGQDGDRDFLTVGGMGHASGIALGISRAAPEDDAWVLDGDGALLMHLGALPVIAMSGPRRLLHVLFDNGVHDSVGGQPTALSAADPVALASAAGYPVARRADGLAAVREALADLLTIDGPRFLHIPIRPGHRPDLGRPTRSPTESRARFMAAVRGGDPG